MSKPKLAIAAGNALGAEAGAEIARAGGNAVDAALAAAVMGWVAEPFFTSIGGSGFIAVRAPDGTVEVIDGNVAMPFTAPRQPGQGIKRVYLDYSDGMYTGIGAGSVAIPGVLAAVHRAWERHGHIEWAAVLEPAIRAARDGLPFPKTSGYYLSVTWNEIWSTYPAAARIFSNGDGEPLVEGDWFVQAELAEALEMIAAKGPSTFYSGELAKEIESAITADDGFMTLEDLSRYEAIVRMPIASEWFGWRIESNPPPSLGGASLVQMLGRLENAPLDDPVARLRAFADAQHASLEQREELYREPDTIAADVAPEVPVQAARRRSADTTHASTADSDGHVCAVTESSGYGSGLLVRGMAFNNTLGEEELNPLGVHSLRPGSRCHSNMAPTIATGADRVVGLGSPGATRIIGAIAQALLRIAVDGYPLADAVSAPRAHLDPREAGETLCYEPGLPGEDVDGYRLRPFDSLHMYFGAVQAASVTNDGTVDAAHDPRRSGGSVLI